MARGKLWKEKRQQIDKEKKYPLSDAIKLVKELSYSSFTWSCELHIKTNANPKFNDQLVRGTVILPHGTGKTIRVAAFVDDGDVDAAKKAGADIAWNTEILESVENGNIDFDTIVTTPDKMRDLAKVARILWPKGLMPSPKAGTVSSDIATTVEAIKKWRIEFKLDKTGNVHAVIGSLGFDDAQLEENYNTFIDALKEAKPSGVSGKLIRKISIAPTMGPGIMVAA